MVLQPTGREGKRMCPVVVGREMVECSPYQLPYGLLRSLVRHLQSETDTFETPHSQTLAKAMSEVGLASKRPLLQVD